MKYSASLAEEAAGVLAATVPLGITCATACHPHGLGRQGARASGNRVVHDRASGRVVHW